MMCRLSKKELEKVQEKSQLKTDESGRSPGAIGWAEMGLVPDSVIRAGIRRLNRQRLQDIHADDPGQSCQDLVKFVENMHIALREGNRYALGIESQLDCAGDVPIDGPIVVGLHPRAHHEIDG